MPISSLVVLLLGGATLFVEERTTWFIYAVACVAHCVQMFFNRQQILEHSSGAEDIMRGSSEFRRATIVLMATWFPFPLWFLMTPEGFGVVQNILVIQMGWATLNIISKFTMILCIQRIKDNYYSLDKFTRDLKIAEYLPKEFDYEEYPETGVLPEVRQEEHAVGEGDGMDGFAMPLAIKGDNASEPSTMDLEPLERRLEQLEWKLMERMDFMINTMTGATGLGAKIEESQSIIRDKIGQGHVDLFKAVEKSYAEVEVKMDMTYREQNKQQQTVLEDIKEQVDNFPKNLSDYMCDTYDKNTFAMEKLQTTLEASLQRMEAQEETQRTEISSLDTSVTHTLDGWAQQIIQDSKAAAFTLQSKIGVMEEMQTRRAEDLEQKVADRLQALVNRSCDGLEDRVVQQTLVSTEKLHASIESTNTKNTEQVGNLHQNVTQMIKDLQADNARHLEGGFGIFGNSFRGLLDNMKTAQITSQADSEKNITAKVDSLLRKQVSEMNSMIKADLKKSMAQAAQDQTSGLTAFKGMLEEVARNQKESHQDLSSAVSSVLEQACGAKLRTDECTQRLGALCSKLDERQRSPQRDARESHRDDVSDTYENRTQSGSSQTGDARPNTARRSKYGQVGGQVISNR
jgi:hypothetical protein